ncbi:MAG: hypothetical protein LAN63_10035 [Acidobacteriia bacterium]|nr:hypothetical protein [Terriglobia bacterium]
MNADGSNGGSGTQAGCLSPEPYSYESGFAVQRLIVAQINQDAQVQNNDPYSGTVTYRNNGTGSTPWFDWGPYLWADADNPRPDGLFWCDTISTSPRCIQQGFPDLRFGDLDDPGLSEFYWGDHVHPTVPGAGKVAGQIITWLGQPGSRNAWTPWLDAP